jgi:hypothetical protein
MTTFLYGGCCCGRIRFRVHGQPVLIAACHCNDCRRHTGAPVAVYVDVQATQLELLGEPIDWFETSPGAQRGFCCRCGATLAFRGSNLPTEVHIHVGAFDEPATLSPVQNEMLGSRMPWLSFLASD